jgi:hypothetical protein
MSSSFDRRKLLSGAAALSASALAQTNNSGMPKRTLGRTGEKVSALGLGGYHIGNPKLSEDESIRIIRSALDRGLNFMDNS